VNEVDISLVIATRNRSAQLRRTLPVLTALGCRVPWELIVADNGSTDDTASVVAAVAAAMPARPVRYVYEGRPGLAHAHNSGFADARGRIIAFTDDDCYPDAGFLDAIVDCFEEDANLGFLGGRILLHDPTDLPVTIQTSTERLVFEPGRFLPAGIIQGANFAVRRTALQAAGGFDPWFGPGAHFNAEEVELCARLSAAGWRGAYDPRPLVFHHHGRKSGEDQVRLIRSYGRGRGAYYAKSLTNARLRWAFLKGWGREVSTQPVARTLQELRAAAEFFVRAAADRGRRFTRPAE
jgi:GT2 family glycosyltransferase